MPVDGKYYHWIPYTKAPNSCELNCMPKDEKFYYRQARRVIDGTKCHDDGSFDICVEGICTPVGCDQKLGSNATEDRCRVCGGDGSSCQSVRRIYDVENLGTGYKDIILIPKGATHINVYELRPTHNYLALRDANGTFYLNGNWQIEFPKEIKLANTTFYYERRPHTASGPESLRALGPTSEPVFIVLLCQEKNSGVSYEYSVPKDVSIPNFVGTDTYSWDVGEYQECSKTCGGGVQMRQVMCLRRSDRRPAPDYLCDARKAPENIRHCNYHSCPPSWFVGNWSSCLCPGFKHRLVYCQKINRLDEILALSSEEPCQYQPKPSAVQICKKEKCILAARDELSDGINQTESEIKELFDYHWNVSEWSSCNSRCGEGFHNRSVECLNAQNELVEDSLCDAVSFKPTENETCNEIPCEGVDWITSDWSSCEVNCGSSISTRTVLCSTEEGEIYPDDVCDEARKPKADQQCSNYTGCEAQWFKSEWSNCSVTCGEGFATRIVFCGHSNGDDITKLKDEHCLEIKKPSVNKMIQSYYFSSLRPLITFHKPAKSKLSIP